MQQIKNYYSPFDRTTTTLPLKLDFLFDVIPSNKEMKWKNPALINIMIEKYISDLYFKIISTTLNLNLNFLLSSKWCSSPWFPLFMNILKDSLLHRGNKPRDKPQSWTYFLCCTLWKFGMYLISVANQ